MVNARPDNPPQIATSICFGHKFRFLASAAISSRNLTFVELLDLLCVAVTTTSAYRICGSVKLNSIEMWAATTTASSSQTVSFQKFGSLVGAAGNSKLYSDTALGVSNVAHVKVRFNDGEQLGQWQNGTATGIYGAITIPQGGVVDLSVTFTLNEVSGTAAVTGTVAAASVGQIYLRSLDNGQATPQLTPISYVTI